MSKRKHSADIRKYGGDGPTAEEMFTRNPHYWSVCKTRYGVTKEQVLSALHRQGGGCGICGHAGRGLHIDHEHQTKKFRGVLCHECNRGLGYFGDSLAGIKKAFDYLLENGT